MRFCTQPHPFYCGIDLPARSMYVCIVHRDGEILLHRPMKAAPDPFLKAVAPYRDGLVVAVAWRCTWYWLADRCTEEGIPFVLGHARYLNAIHGGKAKHDTLDSHTIAVLRRGAMLPQADVYPADLRATRDLRRRRTHLLRTRAELLAHVPNTNSQDTLPEIGKNIAYQAPRAGVAERFADPAVHKPIDVDLALITADDQLLGDIELAIIQAAKPQDANTLYLGQTVPGIGNILSLVRLDDIHRLDRFPSVPQVASYGRLVKGRKESGGQRWGTSGAKIGNAHLQWAFSEAAVLGWRNTPKAKSFWPAWRTHRTKATP